MLNKKLLLFTTFSVSLTYTYSQVGIGTTNPHHSSLLDVQSNNKGMLLPRVQLISNTDVVTVENPATSLLVYNTNTNSSVNPGFYYWDGKWNRLMNDALVDNYGSWKLKGNILEDGTEFLGTNNYYPLNFKVNATNIGRFYPNGGFSLGIDAISNENRSFAIGYGANASIQVDAFAIGGTANASGYRSAAIGYGSRATQTDAFSLGYNASATGYRSMALGSGSLSSQNDAIAVGFSAKAQSLYSTALGYQANANGQSATAIGYNAITTQPNAIVLGDSSSAHNKVGIGTNSPDERLHIVGSVKIVDGTQGKGRVLTSDSTGKSTWVDSESLKSYGEIYRTNNTSLTSGVLSFNANGANQNVTLNSDSIQVTQSGLYKVTYTLTLAKNSGTTISPYFYLGIWGSEIQGTRTYCTITNGNTQSVSLTKYVNLNAYQGVTLSSSLADSGANIVGNATVLTLELIKRS